MGAVMLFQHTWQRVLSGKKTQTRRLRHNGELLFPSPHTRHRADEVKGVETPLGRVKWQVGKTYAVQPFRKHPTMLWSPDHPCYGVDILQPYDMHYAMARDGAWKPAGQGYIPARIRVTDIRREDVREISIEDFKAEGYDCLQDFWTIWCAMHDPAAFEAATEPGHASWFEGHSYDLKCFLRTRPADRYDAYALTFELVK